MQTASERHSRQLRQGRRPHCHVRCARAAATPRLPTILCDP